MLCEVESMCQRAADNCQGLQGRSVSKHRLLFPNCRNGSCQSCIVSRGDVRRRDLHQDIRGYPGVRHLIARKCADERQVHLYA